MRFSWKARLGFLVAFATVAAVVGLPGCGRSDTRASAATEFADPFLVELTGSERAWHVRYPGLPGATAAARKLRDIPVPAGRDVVFVLKSTDFLYTFDLPGRGLKEIAAPGLEFRLTLSLPRSGRVAFVGEPMCSDPHEAMTGEIVAEPADRFLAWARSGRRPGTSVLAVSGLPADRR